MVNGHAAAPQLPDDRVEPVGLDEGHRHHREPFRPGCGGRQRCVQRPLPPFGQRLKVILA